MMRAIRFEEKAREKVGRRMTGVDLVKNPICEKNPLDHLKDREDQSRWIVIKWGKFGPIIRGGRASRLQGAFFRRREKAGYKKKRGTFTTSEICFPFMTSRKGMNSGVQGKVLAAGHERSISGRSGGLMLSGAVVLIEKGEV